MKRRNTTLAAIAVTLASLAACGSDDAATNPAAEPGPAAPVATATAEAPATTTTAPATTTTIAPARPPWVSDNGILTVGWLPDGYETTPIKQSIEPGEGPTPYGAESQRFGDVANHQFITVATSFGPGATVALDDPDKGLAGTPGGYVARDDLLPGRAVYVTSILDQVTMSWIAGPDLVIGVTGQDVDEETLVRVATSVTVKAGQQ